MKLLMDVFGAICAMIFGGLLLFVFLAFCMKIDIACNRIGGIYKAQFKPAKEDSQQATVEATLEAFAKSV